MSLHEQVHLLLLADGVDRLRDLVDRLARRGDVDVHRVVQRVAGDAHDLRRHRRREEQVLALAREHGQDALHVGQEAHVEHAVGLVEDEHLDACERSQSRLLHRSSRRPGVATSTSTPRRSALACGW